VVVRRCLHGAKTPIPFQCPNSRNTLVTRERMCTPHSHLRPAKNSSNVRTSTSQPLFSHSFIHSFIHSFLHPTEYVAMRALGQAHGGKNKMVTATPRQLEALIRLSEALARMRLAEEVGRGDVVEATRLMKAATQTVGARASQHVCMSCAEFCRLMCADGDGSDHRSDRYGHDFHRNQFQ
jgi:hypothetical protein